MVTNLVYILVIRKILTIIWQLFDHYLDQC